MSLQFKGDPSKMDGPIGQLFKSMGGKKPEDNTPAGEQPSAGEGMKKGGKVSASARADGCATKGKTRGKMI
jgi:hypothetical protein